MHLSAAGVLYAVYGKAAPFARTLVSIDAASMSVLQEQGIGNFNVGDLDHAPDGQLYHSNFSHALIRLDPSTGVQSVVGFGAIGALGGIASVVPEPAAAWLGLAGLWAVPRATRRRSHDVAA